MALQTNIVLPNLRLNGSAYWIVNMGHPQIQKGPSLFSEMQGASIGRWYLPCPNSEEFAQVRGTRAFRRAVRAAYGRIAPPIDRPCRAVTADHGCMLCYKDQTGPSL
jgi:hypothetical protein